MEGSPIDIVIFAPLAPILGVLLFWFIQLLFIESQKYLLEKIRPKHEPLCRFTNFLGVLYQSMCHALGYTVTKSGISDFYISVNYGRVAPKREKKGIFEWVSNAFLFMGPFFIPAILIIIYLFLLGFKGFDTTIPSQVADLKYTFGGQLTTFGINLYNFSNSLLNFLVNLDLLHPGHFGFLLLLIFLGLGIRPSHIGEKKVDKVDMVYDLKNIWRLITQKKFYLILLFSIIYLFFYISLLLNQTWYVIFFSFLGWLSIISIVALFITHAIIYLIKTTDGIKGRKKYLSYIVILASYIFARIFFHFIKADFDLSTSLFIMIISTMLALYLIKREKNEKKTQKFKTKIDIKSLEKIDEGETDER